MNWRVSLVVCLLLLSPSITEAICYWSIAGGVATVAAAPVVLPALGFGAGGIAAGSLAAKAMSLAWSTGYGVGLVSAAQSAGAVGLSMTAKTAAAAAGAMVTQFFACRDSGPDC